MRWGPGRRWDWLLQAAWLWAGSWFGRAVRNVGWPMDGRKEEPQEQGHRYPLGWGKLGLYSHLREGFMVYQCVLSWGWGKRWTEWAFQSIHYQRILLKRLLILLHIIGHNTFSVQYLSSGVVMESVPNTGNMGLAQICTNTVKSNHSCLFAFPYFLPPAFLSALLSSCKYGAVFLIIYFQILYSFFLSISEMHPNDENLLNTKYLIWNIYRDKRKGTFPNFIFKIV